MILGSMSIYYYMIIVFLFAMYMIIVYILSRKKLLDNITHRDGGHRIPEEEGHKAQRDGRGTGATSRTCALRPSSLSLVDDRSEYRSRYVRKVAFLFCPLISVVDAARTVSGSSQAQTNSMYDDTIDELYMFPNRQRSRQGRNFCRLICRVSSSGQYMCECEL